MSSSCCAGSRRSQTTERLPRLSAWNVAAAPSKNGGPHARASSPPGLLDLDDEGPEICEQLADERRGDALPELDRDDALERCRVSHGLG